VYGGIGPWPPTRTIYPLAVSCHGTTLMACVAKHAVAARRKFQKYP